MKFRRLGFLAAALMWAQPAFADPTACPAHLDFDGKLLRLAYATIDIGEGDNDAENFWPEKSLGRNRYRYYIDMTVPKFGLSRPWYLICVYGSVVSDRRAIVTLPDDILGCTKTFQTVQGPIHTLSMTCVRPHGREGGATISKTEILTEATELSGYRLRLTRDQVGDVIASNGDQVIETEKNGEPQFDISPSDGRGPVRLTLSATSGRVREIAAVGPKQADGGAGGPQRNDFLFTFRKRFGPTQQNLDYVFGSLQLTEIWRVADTVQAYIHLEYWKAKPKSGAVDEVRLVDLSDPQSRADRDCATAEHRFICAK